MANKQHFAFIMLLFCCEVSLSAQNYFFVSSNTQQTVGAFEVTTDGFITENTFRNITADGDGNNLVPPVDIKNLNTKLVVDSTPKAVTFKIYPNPVSDNLTLELLNTGFKAVDKTTITIYDAFGKQMQQIDTYSLQLNIDISRLSDGVYYIIIAQNDQVTTQKFIKTK